MSAGTLYWDNHDQPRAVSRFGDDDPVWRARSTQRRSRPCCTCTGARPASIRGRGTQDDQCPFAHRRRRGHGRSATTRRAIDAGADHQRCCGIQGRDNLPRTPVQWDAGPHAELHHEASRGHASPNHTGSARPARITGPDSVRAQRLIALPQQPTPSLGHFEMLLDDHPTVGGSPAPSTTSFLSPICRRAADLADFGGAGAIDEWVGAQWCCQHRHPPTVCLTPRRRRPRHLHPGRPGRPAPTLNLLSHAGQGPRRPGIGLAPQGVGPGLRGGGSGQEGAAEAAARRPVALTGGNTSRGRPASHLQNPQIRSASRRRWPRPASIASSPQVPSGSVERHSPSPAARLGVGIRR